MKQAGGCGAAAPHPPSSTHNMLPRMFARPGDACPPGRFLSRGSPYVSIKQYDDFCSSIVVLPDAIDGHPRMSAMSEFVASIDQGFHCGEQLRLVGTRTDRLFESGIPVLVKITQCFADLTVPRIR